MATVVKLQQNIEDMFCMQCAQTLNCTGCTKIKGVCGKTAQNSSFQDLTIEYIKGICQFADRLNPEEVPNDVHDLILGAAFATLTNVNFDDNYFLNLFKILEKARDQIKPICLQKNEYDEFLKEGPAAFVYSNNMTYLIDHGKKSGVVSRKQEVKNEDLFGLIELIMYGLKGACAYFYHANMFSQHNFKIIKPEEKVNIMKQLIHCFRIIAENKYWTVDILLKTSLEVGKIGLEIMDLLDKCHNTGLGVPVPTEVKTIPTEGKCILISGHDLLDLLEVLKQTQGKGINVYTHGEMLPAHGYPLLKKFTHLAGNFGDAWFQQQSDFAKFPGPIILTSNCLIEPDKKYSGRIFTKNVVGWPGIPHIQENDYSAVIQSALKEPGFTKQDIEKIKKKTQNETVGFGHTTILSVAGKVIEAIQKGKLKHIFVIGGCDSRNIKNKYYRELALGTPSNSLILTLGCLKYRLRELNLGNIESTDLPRFMDLGQCNDSYSAIKVAVELAKALNTEVNDLPLHLVLGWFEQKAVLVLLTLLHLGIKKIRIGPVLPAWLTQNLLNVLIEKFQLTPISNAKDDLAAMLK